MENHRRGHHGHNRSGHGFSSLFRSSCRFDVCNDVIESSVVSQILPIQSTSANTRKHEKNRTKPKTRGRICPPATPISVTVKQSSSSNSGLFSTEEDGQGVDSEVEIDDYFGLSSDSSLSSCSEIGISRRKLGFPGWIRDGLGICEIGHCSSSEASTSCSNNSNSPLKDSNPRVRTTLAEKLGYRSKSFRRSQTDHLGSNSFVSDWKTQEIRPKKQETEHHSSNSFVPGRKTGEFSRRTTGISSNPHVYAQKNGKTGSNYSVSTLQTAEITRKTEHLHKESTFSATKTGETEHLRSESLKKTSKTREDPGILLCPMHIGGKIENSYAVEKESRDPYRDFRESMVEMIAEKKISEAEDFEKLLLCFLSLNSSAYHRAILDVFHEVCEGLVRN